MLEKPLAALLYHFNSQLLHALVHTLYIVYFYLFGPRFRRLLEKLEFDEKESQKAQKQQQKLIFLTVFTAIHLIIVASLHFLLNFYLKNSAISPLETVLNLAAAYVDALYCFLPLLCCHFIEWAVQQKVKKILALLKCIKSCHQTLSKTKTETTEQQITLKLALNCLREVATQKDALTSLTSFFVLLYILLSTIDVLVYLCLVQDNFPISYFFFVFIIFAYLVYIVQLNQQTLAFLDGAASLLAAHRCTNCTNENFLPFLLPFFFCGKVYKQYFAFRVYNLFGNIDYAFLLRLVLFTLAYFVFLLQTKTL